MTRLALTLPWSEWTVTFVGDVGPRPYTFDVEDGLDGAGIVIGVRDSCCVSHRALPSTLSSQTTSGPRRAVRDIKWLVCVCCCWSRKSRMNHKQQQRKLNINIRCVPATRIRKATHG